MTVVLTFIFVIVVTAVLFGSWVLVSIFRFIGRLFSGNSNSPMLSAGNARSCDNPACRTINPQHASYCRRCGSNLTNPSGNLRFNQSQRAPQYDRSNGNVRQMAKVS